MFLRVRWIFCISIFLLFAINFNGYSACLVDTIELGRNIKLVNSNVKNSTHYSNQNFALPPIITPGPVTFCGSGYLVVSGYGANVSSFKWFKNNIAILGSDNDSLMVNSSDSFYCIIYRTTLPNDTTTKVRVTINSIPNVTVSSNAVNNSICKNSSTILTASGASSYSWSPSSGLSSNTGAIVTASPTNSLTYTVTGTQNGCIDTAQIRITVNGLPTVNIKSNVSNNTICNGSSVIFTVSGAYSYSLAPTLGVIGLSDTTFRASPVTNTMYTVTGTDNNGCTDTAKIQITVLPKPTASFTYSPINSCGGKKRKITFISTSTGVGSGNNVYKWNFGDPSTGDKDTSNKSNPSHEFSGHAATSFVVTLTVSGNNGCKDTYSQTINLGQFPDATLTDPYNFPEFRLCNASTSGLIVQNSSSTIDINTNYNIEWGDGTNDSSSTMESLNHIYPSTGFFYINFIVEAGGCRDSTQYEVYIGSNPAIGLSTSGNTTYLCVPSTKTFYVDTVRTKNNPLGTIYTVQYNDGVTDLVFSHPPPFSFDHTFNSSSCGATPTTQANTFEVKIFASNPCGTSPAQVGAITTVLPPDANFTISPDTIVCENSNVQFSNSSLEGTVVVTNGSGPSTFYTCDKTNLNFWSISSITGLPNSWTVTGNLGSYSSFSGDQNISVNFSKAGIYQVQLIVRNAANSPGACRNDTIKKYICVQPHALPSFTSSPISGCIPLNVDFTNTSNKLPTCGTFSRVWRVNKLLSNCGTTSSSYQFINSTDSTSQSPSIQFNKEGNYEVMLFIKTICGWDSSLPKTITVKDKPKIVINTISPICVGDSIAPNSLICASGGTISDYNWGFPGGQPSAYISNITPNPGMITFNNSGTYYIYDTVINECGVTNTSTFLTVRPLPSATINGSTSVCQYATSPNITFTGAGSTAPYTFTYNINNGSNQTATTISGNSIILPVPTSTSGVFNYNLISIKDATSTQCSQSQTGTATITVIPLPTAFISGTTNVCQNSTSPSITFIGAGGTAPYTFTYNINNGSNQTITTVTGNSVSLSAPTTMSGVFNYNLVSVKDATSSQCSKSQTGTATITVNPLPTASISGTTSVCQNATSPSITFTGAAGTAPYTFTYNINNGSNQTITTTSGNFATISVPTSTSGVFNYNLVSVKDATSTQCSQSQTGTATITVNPVPTALISGTTSVCQNATSPSITFTGAGGTAPYTFTYNINNGSNQTVSTTSGNSITVTVPTTASGVFNYNLVSVKDATNTQCSQSQTGTATITVNPIPTAFISGTTSVCQNATSPSITFTGAGGTAPYTFTYNINNGSNQTVSTTSGNSITVTVPTTASGVFNYNLVSVKDATNTQCSQSQTGTATITVNPIPTAFISGTTSVCQNATSPSITFTGAGGTAPYTFTYNINNGSNQTVSTTSGNSITVTVPTTASGVFNYNLVSVKDATSTQCSQSQTGTATITLNSLPLAYAGKDTSICSESTLIIGATSISGYSYSWSPSSGLSSSTISNPIFSTTNTTSSPITYTYILTVTDNNFNTYCLSKDTILITVKPNPVVDSLKISAQPNNCTLGNGSILVYGLIANNPYTLTYNNVSIQISAASSANPYTIPNLTPGTYIITDTLNGCGSIPKSISLNTPNPTKKPIASNDTSVCLGQAFRIYVVNDSIQYSYTWYGPNNNVVSSNNFFSVNSSVSPNTGWYSVTATINNCVSNRDSVYVTILALPPKPGVRDTTYCQFSSVNSIINLATSNFGDTLFWYGLTNNLIAGAPIPSTTIASTFSPVLPVVSYYVNQIDTTTKCIGPKDTIRIYVNPTPVLSDTGTSICSSDSFNIRPNYTPANNFYCWTIQSVNPPGSIKDISGNSPRNQPIPKINIGQYLINTTPNIAIIKYQVTPKTKNIRGNDSCIGNSFIVTISVKPKPKVKDSSTHICSGSAFSITPDSSLPGNIIPFNTVFSWSVTSTNVIGQTNQSLPVSSISQSLTNITNTPQIVNYTVTPKTINSPGDTCIGQVFDIAVKVNPTPKIQGQQLTICSKDSFSIVPLNNQPSTIVPVNTTYTWTLVSDNVNVIGDSAQSSPKTSIGQRLTNLTNVVQQVIYVVTPVSGDSGKCIGSIFRDTVNVNPTPVIKDTVTTICSNGTFVVSPSNVQPMQIVPSGTTYTWAVASNPNVTGQSNNNTASLSISQTLRNKRNVIDSVIYSVSPKSSNGCVGDSFKLKVYVNPTPEIPNQIFTICGDSSFRYLPVNGQPASSTIVSLNTSYTWTVSTNNTNLTGQNNQSIAQSGISDTLINNSNTPQQIVYTVTPTSGDTGRCLGLSFTITVNVNPKPRINNQIDTICSGSSFTISPQNIPNVQIVPNGTSYVWSVVQSSVGLGNVQGGSGASITGTLYNPSDTIEKALYMVVATGGVSVGSCTKDTFIVTVFVNPAPRISFSLDSQRICSGGSTQSVSISSATPNVSLPWYSMSPLPTGLQSSGIITNGNVTIPSQTLVNLTNVPVLLVDTARAITSGSNGCPGVKTPYKVYINPTPKIQGQQLTICSKDSFSIVPLNNQPSTIVPVNTTYTWTLVSDNVNVIGDSAQSSPKTSIGQRLTNLTNVVQQVIYVVTPVSGDSGKCIGSIFRDTVNVNPTPVIKDTVTTICSNGTFVVSPSNVQPMQIVPSGTTYTWAVASNPNVTGQSNNNTASLSISQTLKNLTNKTDSVIYTVWPKSNLGCAGDSFKLKVYVNPTPVLLDTAITVCNNVPFVYTPANRQPNQIVPINTTYSWTVSPSPSTTIIGQSSQSIGQLNFTQTLTNNTVKVDSVVYILNPTSGDSGHCIGNSYRLTVKVTPDAKSTFTFTKDTACWPFALSITNTSATTANGGYNWYLDNRLLGSSYSFPGYTINPSDTFVEIKLSTASLYGCKNDSSTHKFYTKNKPHPSFTMNYLAPGCGPLDVHFTNNTASNTPNLIKNYKYFWTFGYNGLTSTLEQPSNVIYPPNPNFGDTTYHIRLKAYNECDTQFYDGYVTVKAKPKALFTPNLSNICSNTTISLQNTSFGLQNNYHWIFDDGSNDTIVNNKTAISHVYNTGVIDTLFPTLIAFNACGNDTMSFPIVVTPITIGLNFNVTGPTQTGCVPHTANFMNASAGGALYIWNFGDPASGSSNTITTSNFTPYPVNHTFNQCGVFQVMVHAYNACSDTTAYKTVNVICKPSSSFQVVNSGDCINHAIQFNNTTTSNNPSLTSYSWDFGDGSPLSNLQNPNHVYATSGNYSVTLTATLNDLAGHSCVDVSSKTVKIVDTLTGSISMSYHRVSCIPFAVTFSNNNINSLITTWDFGDGSSASGISVSHTYYSNGIYPLIMNSMDAGGCHYQVKDTLIVAAPNGTLGYNPTTLCGSKEIQFVTTAFATDSVTWIFNDGTSLTSSFPFGVNHTYLQPGIYYPSIDLHGANGTCTIRVNGVLPIRVDSLIPDFNYSVQAFCDSTNITCNDNSYAFSGLVNHTWNFGDGSPFISGPTSISHNFTTSNSYQLIETIQSQWGCIVSDTSIFNVHIHSAPSVQINYHAVDSACINEILQFNATINSIDTINLIKWVITASNGNVIYIGYGDTINFTLNTPDLYTVTLVAGTIFGCFDTVSHSFIVYPIPNLIVSNDQTICLNNSITLQASGSTNYLWGQLTYPPSLSCYNCPNPLATPLITTTYTVTTLEHGCRDTDTVVITVIQPFNMTVSLNDTICIGESAQLLVAGASNYLWIPSNTLSCSTCSNPIANPTNTTQYIVLGYDNYNCFTDYDTVEVAVGMYPIVVLPNSQVLSTGTFYPIIPSITNGPVRNLTWTPSINLDSATSLTPIATIKNDICYTLEVDNIYGCKSADTFCIKVFCKDVQTYIPNAFTPDGDGINDILMVRATGINTVKTFRIFNRWGQLVFECNNFQPNNPKYGWNGKVNGIPATSDVFVYVVEVLCDNNVAYSYKGNVTLIN